MTLLCLAKWLCHILKIRFQIEFAAVVLVCAVNYFFFYCVTFFAWSEHDCHCWTQFVMLRDSVSLFLYIVDDWWNIYYRPASLDEISIKVKNYKWLSGCAPPHPFKIPLYKKDTKEKHAAAKRAITAHWWQTIVLSCLLLIKAAFFTVVWV